MNGTGFDPEGGSVALRISPVAGFQGLMRVQDALVRVPGVREAGVEAYAQGEARLRLQLAKPFSSTQLKHRADSKPIETFSSFAQGDVDAAYELTFRRTRLGFFEVRPDCRPGL